MADEKIRVMSYSGYRDEEMPRAFFRDDRKIDTIDVLEAWREEGLNDKARLRFFKVRGSDGFIHKIYLDEKTNEWYRRVRRTLR
jgi:hypothetical protein